MKTRKFIVAAIGLFASILTIATWLVSSEYATSAALSEAEGRIIQAQKDGERQLLAGLIENLDARGVDVTNERSLLQDGDLALAVDALSSRLANDIAVMSAQSSTLAPPSATFDTLNVSVGRIYELTEERIPFVVTRISRQSACVTIDGGGACSGLGDYRSLGATGCEAAVMSVSSSSNELEDIGEAEVRVRCGYQRP